MAAFSDFESHPSIPVLYRTLSVKTSLAIGGKQYEPKFEIIPELSQPVDDLCHRLRTHKTRGLSSEAARQRHLEQGANVLTRARRNYTKKFFSHLFGGFNFLLMISAALVFISWRPLSGDEASSFGLGVGIMLLIVIVVSTVFYALVDIKATRTMASIQSLVANTAMVKRDGELYTIDAETLVEGDIVCLKQGQRVPADLRLIDVSSDARFDRSILTGESQPVPATVDPTSLNPLESKNMGLASTFLSRGNVRGVVIKIGDDTVIGNILKMSIASTSKMAMSPIQKEVAFFTTVISILAVFFFCLAIGVWGLWVENNFPGYETASVAITNAIGCLIAFVPEGLPICFALALTIIARRMAKQNALVKNLNMVETLGCISVLCSDKTGTLTVGKMTVDSIMFIDANVSVSQGRIPTNLGMAAIPDHLLRIARLCNDAIFDANTEHLPVQDRRVHGDPTDSAILLFAETIRPLFPEIPHHEILYSLAFNAKNKFMAKITETESGEVAMLIKGAPDVLLRASRYVMQSDGNVIEIDMERRQAIDDIRDNASRQGHRVIALCEKPLDPESIPIQQVAQEIFVMDEIQRDLIMIGLLILRDPPRQEVPETVQKMRNAGIRVFMITGDFELTACSIASSVGLITVADDRIKRVADLQALKERDPLPDNLLSYELRPPQDSPPTAILINGSEIDHLFQDDWDYIAAKFNEMVFARTTPEQKLIIVDNLRNRGDNFVAVTGDGMNDAPALKAADVGVSMGCGTDIAKEAAAIILLNNTFSSLLVGIENGRLVFANLKKVLLYLMTAGVYAEFVAVASHAYFGMQVPLSAFQQVMFCMTNDLIMSISLMYEKPEANLMDHPPRNARTDRLTDWRFFIQLSLLLGPLVWISCMGMWFLYMSTQGLTFYDLIFAFGRWGPKWQSKSPDELLAMISTGQCIYYVTMAICQIGVLLAVRNRTVSLFDSNPLWGPRQNLFILFSIACNVAICIIIFYGYWIQVIFFTTPIPVNFWFIPFGSLAAIVLVDEVRKYFVRNYPISPISKIAW